jgi:ABC-type uncharacterized transport system
MATRGKKPAHLRSVSLRVALQIVAALIVTGSVVGWSLGHYHRYDFSRSRRFELSNQSKEMMWFLNAPVRVIVYFSPSSMATGAELYGDIMALLREFQFYAHHFRDLRVERLDPLRDPARAHELQAKYKFSGAENVIIVEYNGRSTIIPAPEMGEYDTAPTQYGDRPRLVAFRGEQILTSALIALIEPGSNKKVYFLQGHGEGLPGIPPLQLVGQNLKRQNITVAPLNLAAATTVPKDAALVAIDGAHFDPTPEEMASLEAYWKAGGHMLVLLDPTGDTPALDTFLANAGNIIPRDDRVVRLVNLGGAMGILRDVTGEFFAGSEITSHLVGLNVLMAGNTRSLAINDQRDKLLSASLPTKASSTNSPAAESNQTPNQGAPVGNMGTTRPLMRGIHGFRGCSNYANTDGKGITFDPVKDNFFPVIIAAMTDLGGVHDDRLALGASRMVVVGNCEFLKDKFLTGTGLDFFSSAMNTLIDRTRLAGTTPKTKQFFTLNLDDQQLRFLALWTMLAIPLASALLGIIVLWRRRP